VSTFHNDDFCEARLPMLCSGWYEVDEDKLVKKEKKENNEFVSD